MQVFKFLQEFSGLDSTAFRQEAGIKRGNWFRLRSLSTSKHLVHFAKSVLAAGLSGEEVIKLLKKIAKNGE